MRFETLAFIVLLSLMLVGAVASLTSDELDELCTVNGSLLYRYDDKWVCGVLPEPTVYNHNNTIIMYNGTLNEFYWNITTIRSKDYQNKTQVNDTLDERFANASGTFSYKIQNGTTWNGSTGFYCIENVTGQYVTCDFIQVDTSADNTWIMGVSNFYDLYIINHTLTFDYVG